MIRFLLRIICNNRGEDYRTASEARDNAVRTVKRQRLEIDSALDELTEALQGIEPPE